MCQGLGGGGISLLASGTRDCNNCNACVSMIFCLQIHLKETSWSYKTNVWPCSWCVLIGGSAKHQLFQLMFSERLEEVVKAKQFFDLLIFKHTLLVMFLQKSIK